LSQIETAKAIIAGKADYLLNVKNSQQTLKKEIEDVQDEALRIEMDTFSTCEKQRGRTKRRVAFSTCDIDWLFSKEHWPGLILH
jgi:hypothetical protein